MLCRVPKMRSHRDSTRRSTAAVCIAVLLYAKMGCPQPAKSLSFARLWPEPKKWTFAPEARSPATRTKRGKSVQTRALSPPLSPSLLVTRGDFLVNVG